MAETKAHDTHPEPNYFGIIIVLAVLTAAEIGATFMPVPKFLIGMSLVILAFWKAAMVALYFMHLKFETKTLGLIAATPIILCVFLMLMLLPDSNPEKNLVEPAAQVSAPAAH
jgi:cytochrome c oxidase subunit 4